MLIQPSSLGCFDAEILRESFQACDFPMGQLSQLFSVVDQGNVRWIPLYDISINVAVISPTEQGSAMPFDWCAVELDLIIPRVNRIVLSKTAAR